MTPAACVVIPTGYAPGQIFAISRRNDFTQWGIPGGKQEEGESNLAAAIREIKEELGVLLEGHLLDPIYCGECYGADGRDFWVTAYLYSGVVKVDWLVPEDGFRIRAMTINDLCADDISPFAPYNRYVKTAWRAFKVENYIKG